MSSAWQMYDIGDWLVWMAQTQAILLAVIVLALCWVLALSERLRAKNQILADRVGALEELEAQYRELYENANDVVYTHDLQGKNLQFNQAGELLLGYSREDLKGMDPFDLLLPECRSKPEEMIRQKLRTRERTTYELSMRAKDGRLVVLEVSTRLIFRGEEPVAVHGVGRDISQRKREESQLRAYRELGRELSRAGTPKEAARILARTAESLLGWDAFVLDLYEEERERVVPVVTIDTVDGQKRDVPPAYQECQPSPIARRVLEKGAELILREPPFVHSPEAVSFGDAERASASLMYVPIREGTRNIGFMSVQSYQEKAYTEASLESLQTLADFCGGALQRMQAQAALGESERRFRGLFENAPLGIAIVRSGSVLLANPAFLQLFGMDREQVTGTPVVELIAKARRKEFEERLDGWEQRDGKSPIGWETAGLRFTGEEFALLADGGRIHLQDGPAAVLFLTDVTVLKRLEAELWQAQKLDSIGQLAAGVAHDFNNILSVILGYASLLEMPQDKAGKGVSTAEAAKEIRVAAERAAQLVQQLLAFSRRHAVRLERMDLNELVERIVQVLERLFDKSIRIDTMLHHPSQVRGDSALVEQVVMNLAMNARDAMPGGGVLGIRTDRVVFDLKHPPRTQEGRMGEFARLSVTDEGEGIRPECLGRIFEPFFTTKEVGKGTGLGLASVYGIVKQHQGWIEVESVLQEGSRFDVFFPLETGHPEGGTEAAPPQMIARGTEGVLVVEDEAPLLQLCREVLSSAGYRVLTAATGREGYAVWQQNRSEIGLILTDLMMPGGMSGQQLAERCWKDDPAVPVIFSSGYSADVMDGTFPLREGVNFLPKPYQPAALLRLVRSVLDGVSELGRKESSKCEARNSGKKF